VGAADASFGQPGQNETNTWTKKRQGKGNVGEETPRQKGAGKDEAESSSKAGGRGKGGKGGGKSGGKEGKKNRAERLAWAAERDSANCLRPSLIPRGSAAFQVWGSYGTHSCSPANRS
jgi:hypothetical protein